MKSASWVVVRRDTGEVILETFNPGIASAINTGRYEAVPILQWLVRINQRLRAEREATAS